jgi:hypothetical protein
MKIEKKEERKESAMKDDDERDVDEMMIREGSAVFE